MKRILWLIMAGILLATTLPAQSGIESVLRSIEQNNKELQAIGQQTVAQKLEAKTENNLPDPSVSYTHQFGNKEGLGYQGELVASQSFDFPSAYFQRNKWAKTKAEELDYQQAEKRQAILLEAKGLCLDLIMLNQQRQLLDERLANAEKLSALYATRLEKGDANILETNKIKLELLNVKNETRMNEASHKAKLQELVTLNGGEPLDFAEREYLPFQEALSFDELKAEAFERQPSLKAMERAQLAAERYVGVSKSQGLPGFEVGYRLNTATGGERFNGFLVGISIPLFSNRNQVKKAKSLSRSAELQLDYAATSVENELKRLYDQSLALKISMEEYRQELSGQNNSELLNKALQVGEISMIEYFVNITTYYQSIDNYVQLQNEYQKVIAELYKFRL